MHTARNAIRVTARNPGFVALVVLTLAVGIGSTTAALNVAAAVLVTPLPVEDDPRVVLIAKTLSAGSTLVPFSYAEMLAWREASRTLDGIAGVQYDGAWPLPAEIGERTSMVSGAAVSGNFFDVLGARPTAGRLLVAGDAVAGAEDVAVIGYGLWLREFAGNPGIEGRRIRVNGRPATIVGVAPRGFAFPKNADVWQPLVATRDVLDEGWFSLIGRLKPDATVAQAAEEAAVLIDRLRPARAAVPQGLRATVVPLKEAIVANVRPVLGLFAAAAVLLFLVGCVNAMNLLLVRGAIREREISIRAALGATRWRLIGESLAETTIFAAAGGLLGALVAFWLQRALVAASPAAFPRLEQIGFDGRAAGLAVVAVVLAAGLAGAAPALWTLWAARRGLVGGGASTHASVTTRREIGRQILVGSQLAFALLVTVAAALLVRSLQQLQAIDLGFSVDRLTVVQVPLVAPIYADAQRRQQFFDELVSRMEALPGVAAATPVLLRPFTGVDGWDATFTAEGQTREAALANPGLHLEAVLPNYFSTMGVPILRGRAFVEADRQGAPPVVIVSSSLAHRAWPGSTALGKRLKFGGPESPAPWMTVAGVAGDVRYRDLEAPPPAIYMPLRQSPFPARFLVVRASVEAAPVLSLTQRAVKAIDPAEPVGDALPVAALLAGELAAPRFQMLALGLFAAVTVLLAGVGVFGVLGAFVAQRSRELGLRVALGANRTDLRGLVLARVGWPALLGLIAGTFAALAAMPLMRPLLFQVSALDARAFAAGWMAVTLASVLAALVPLRRAARVDPAALLRAE